MEGFEEVFKPQINTNQEELWHVEGLEEVFKPQEEELWHVEGLEEVFKPQVNTNQEGLWHVDSLEDVLEKMDESTKIRKPLFKKCSCVPRCTAEIWVCPYFGNHWGNLNPNRIIEIKMIKHIEKCHKKYHEKPRK